MLGLFAHPDDEVFCVGGTIAACAEAGADTAIMSLTQGEAGEIRDVAVATRRTLGAARVAELSAAAGCLGVNRVQCLDMGDGRLATLPIDQLMSAACRSIEEFRPDVVVTFGPDGASGHPDHIASSHAALRAVRSMGSPPRLLHARFPQREQFLVDALVDWLTSHEQRFIGTTAFGHALKLFADGTSILGFAADHLEVEWFPAGSFVIEQGGTANSLFCILSGSVDVVVEDPSGAMRPLHTYGAGCFVGEDGLATSSPRNAHVIARDDVTCLVLSPHREGPTSGRDTAPDASVDAHSAGGFSVDVRATLDRKVAALSAHRSQYALDAELFPRAMLEQLLGTEYFVAVDTTG